MRAYNRGIRRRLAPMLDGDERLALLLRKRNPLIKHLIKIHFILKKMGEAEKAKGDARGFAAFVRAQVQFGAEVVIEDSGFLVVVDRREA